jgi:hypothetical protein
VRRTVLGVLDAAVLNVDLIYRVVRSTTHGTDRDTVASSALGSGKGDILDNVSTYFGRGSH